jgi:hypothetical protein
MVIHKRNEENDKKHSIFACHEALLPRKLTIANELSSIGLINVSKCAQIICCLGTITVQINDYDHAEHLIMTSLLYLHRLHFFKKVSQTCQGTANN